MKTLSRQIFIAVMVTLLSAAFAQAQNRERFGISAQAGGVNAVSGQVMVKRQGHEPKLITSQDDLISGDIVITHAGSQAEILLNPGTYLRLAENSEFVLVDNSLDHPNDAEFDPRHSYAELLARIEEADATIYPIYLDTEYETLGSRGRNGHEAYVTARSQLQALADQTGAVMFKAERAEDLEGVYTQVAAELHSLYSVAYAPQHIRTDGKWRKIGVTVSLPGAKVRTKRGYYAK